MTASIDGPALQRVYSLARPFVLIGSSPDCDIVLPLRDIPPVALCLLLTHDAAHWIDLASPSSQWRSGPFDLSGCLVWRGYHLDLQRVREETNPAAGANSLTDGGAASDGRLEDIPKFDVSFDGERLARAKLTHMLTLVGQSDRCRLRLRNRHVALEHCLLYVAGRRVWVIDLLSEKGTFLRGRRISAGEVLAGDVVTVGKPHLTMLRWSRRSSDAGSSSDILIGTPVHDDATQAIVLDTGDTAETNEGLSPTSPNRSAGPIRDPLRDTAFDMESLRATTPEITPPAQVSSASEVPASDAATPTGEPTTSLPAGDNSPADENWPADQNLSAHESLSADSDPVVLPPLTEFAPARASARNSAVDLDAMEATLAAVAMPPSHPPHSRALALLPADSPAAESSAAASPIAASQLTESPAAHQALDRLIVRHRRQHRKRTLIWTTVGSIGLAAFLAGVHWATENVNFHDTSFDFNLEAAPPQAAQPDSANQSAPSSQRSADEGLIGADPFEFPTGDAR
jgi:hypothetical protein